MKIGVISDTHDNLRATEKAINIFNKEKIDLLIHCGDWIAPFSMRIFTKISAPIKAVLGNNDPDIQKFQYQLQNLPILKKLDLNIQPQMQDIQIDKKRIAVVHGDDANLIKLIIESQLYDVLCYGHIHSQSINKKGETLIINPGSMVGYSIEDGGIVPRTIAIYNTQLNEAKIINIDSQK